MSDPALSSSQSTLPPAAGEPLAWRSLGSGEPMLLIAGLAGEAKFWDSVLPALSQRYRVVVFDQRGFGASAPLADDSDAECSIAALARDALSVLDSAGIADAIIVGHSTGGAIAQTIALDHPERVSRLVLSSTWGKANAYMHYLFALRCEVMRVGGRDQYAALTRMLGYPTAWWTQGKGVLPAPVVGSGAADTRFFPRVRALLAFDRAADLCRLSLPTLVLGTQDDQIIPHDRHTELAQLIAGAETDFQQVGGHFFPQILPDQFSDPVLSWLGAAK